MHRTKRYDLMTIVKLSDSQYQFFTSRIILLLVQTCRSRPWSSFDFASPDVSVQGSAGCTRSFCSCDFAYFGRGSINQFDLKTSLTSIKLRLRRMMPAPGFIRALRAAAPSLSQRFFACHHEPVRKVDPRVAFSRVRYFNTSIARTSTQPKPRPNRGSLVQQARAFSACAKARTTVSSAPREPRSKSQFPDTSSNTVAYWLLGSAASVFGIVVFGGLTRLTESG